MSAPVGGAAAVGGGAAAPAGDWTADEMMSVAAARALEDGTSCFVGIGLPSTAANLARRTHAPRLVLVYEAGAIGAKPARLPLSIGDGILAETADAVANIDAICMVDDVDVVFLGPTDLSHSLGLAGHLDHPDVVAAMDEVAGACQRHGLALGIFCGSVEMAVQWLDKGARYIVTGAEGLMARAMHSFLEEVRR